MHIMPVVTTPFSFIQILIYNTPYRHTTRGGQYLSCLLVMTIERQNFRIMCVSQHDVLSENILLCVKKQKHGDFVTRLSL